LIRGRVRHVGGMRKQPDWEAEHGHEPDTLAEEQAENAYLDGRGPAAEFDDAHGDDCVCIWCSGTRFTPCGVLCRTCGGTGRRPRGQAAWAAGRT